MAADALNRINPLPAGPRAGDPGVYPGDLPPDIKARYYTETKLGAAFAFYRDAVGRDPSFRDHGGRLSTERNDPHVVRDLIAIARHRGWDAIGVRGQTDFRREVWLQARLAGLEVRGYPPTERDRQELTRRLERESTRGARRREAAPKARTPEPARGTPAETRMRIVESVVRSRIVEPAAQARILAAARERLAAWLERGARPATSKTRERAR
jgi:hypothetical protein